MLKEIGMVGGLVAAGVSGVVFLPAWWRRLQEFLAWRSDLKSIRKWAERDRLDEERLGVVAAIYRKWPETVGVELEPMDPVGYEERVRLTREAMGVATLLRVYKARAGAVRITLDSRKHKMEICDARRVGLAVEVREAVRAVSTGGQGGAERGEEVGTSRHGRREGRAGDGVREAGLKRGGGAGEARV